MNSKQNGFSKLIETIEADLAKREINLLKPQIHTLSTLISCVLTGNSINSSE